MGSAKPLGSILRANAQAKPDEPALLSESLCLTWAELDARVDRFAALLQRCGVRPGDVVGAMITKRPEALMVFLAVARLGAIYAPVNFKLHPDHIRNQFRTADIQTVLTESQFDSQLMWVLPFLPDPNRVIYVGGPGKHGATHTDMAAGLVPPLQWPDVHPDAACYYNYTSGTTGAPKGAVATHRNIISNGEATIAGMGMRADDVYLGMFSVFAHPHELFHRALILGSPFVVLDTMSPRVVAAAVERFQVRWMMAVPSFYELMLDYVDSGADGDRYNLSSLRVLEAGGAYVGKEAMSRMEARFSARFVPVWGSTETTGVTIANGPDERREGSMGRALPGYAVRVVNEEGDEVIAGDVGEMILRGPAVTEGYINNADETAIMYRDGWYYSQDLVTRDESGWFHFIGRKSEMLKIGGIRVSPLEIEMVIKGHPDVREVVVVRAEERIRGEVARAVVSVQPSSGLGARDLQAYCRDRLAVYKVPRIVEFWAEVPKMPNGKVDKGAILAVSPDPARDDRVQSDAV